jgi:7,8-dihydropterin-6-yl-methyl-4-(beta-D-ribofuranosyl)aminobenzene 5'-phosphate synthase
MKITTLIENTKAPVKEDVQPEHGVSLYIEKGTTKILFDTGSSPLFASNADRLGLSLKEIVLSVISHGHFDHGGGLQKFIEVNQDAPIYIKKGAFGSYYFKLLFLTKYIGIDPSLKDTYPHRFVFVDDFIEVREDMYIIADILNNHPRPAGNKRLVKKSGNTFEPDDFAHELILVIREHDGIVVFTGCSHNGILNMLETVEKYFPEEKIKAVFGGFHLMNPLTKKMAEKTDSVTALGDEMYEKPHLEKVYSGHCTGMIAYNLLKSRMKEKLDYFSTGSVITV